MAEQLCSQMERISLQKGELCCPVCYDEFEEPKALPECLHNVCKNCLQEMFTGNAQGFVECPICRVKSKLPPGGVDKLPTNHLMKRLVDGIPGRKEKQALKEAVQDFEEYILFTKSHLYECRQSIYDLEEAKREAQQAKKDISDHTKHLIDVIQTESLKLTSDLDDVIKKNTSTIFGLRNNEQKLSSVVEQAENCVNDVKAIIQRKHLQEMIEKKEESICQLKRLKYALQQSSVFSFLGKSLKNIRFQKAIKILTGKHVFGFLTADSASTPKQSENKGNPIPTGFIFGTPKQPESKGFPIPTGFSFGTPKQPESRGQDLTDCFKDSRSLSKLSQAPFENKAVSGKNAGWLRKKHVNKQKRLYLLRNFKKNTKS